MNYTQSLNWVHSLGRISSEANLNAIKALLFKLGNPEKSLKFIHIAGTNGKGSATIMLSSILKEAGFTVGTNISPYVLCFCERFQINGEMITESELAEVLTLVKNAADKLDGQFKIIEFEAVTAAALVFFARHKCDLVCMEVGLGGRLDATNAIENTLLALIMCIGMDHTELLGDTLNKIATEKCGIIKNKCEVIAYPAEPQEALSVIEASAKKASSNLLVPEIEDIYLYKNAPFENRANYGGYDLTIPLPGIHQAYNAAVVVEAALALWRMGYNISDENIIDGIAKAKFPARIEVISYSPLVILDGAHNPDGARALEAELLRSKATGLTAIMGILKEKNPEEMLKALEPCFARVITVTPDNPRAMSAEDLAALAEKHFLRVEPCSDVQTALKIAQGDKHSGVCICGSLYLAAEARKYLI